MPSINDFLNFDIRVGKITSVEDHPTSRKPMYKLTVDFGTEIGSRTIVAGIKPWYPKEELEGKKAIFIVNLDPKIVAGIESQGMLMAAEDENEVSILVSDKDVAAGSKVH